MPLNYYPQETDILQMRFKVDNVEASNTVEHMTGKGRLGFYYGEINAGSMFMLKSSVTSKSCMYANTLASMI